MIGIISGETITVEKSNHNYIYMRACVFFCRVMGLNLKTNSLLAGVRLRASTLPRPHGGSLMH